MYIMDDNMYITTKNQRMRVGMKEFQLCDIIVYLNAVVFKFQFGS